MFSRAETARVYAALWTLSEWEIKTITILGKQCSMHRELCTFGSPGTRYSYGNDTHVVHPFTEEMEMVRARVEESLGNRFSFNLCLLNKYRSGNDYVGPHSDHEREHVRGTPIVSVSLGATRDFVLQTRAQPGAPAAPKERRVLALGDGDKCVMDAGTQEHYKHSIPQRKGVPGCRISLTFRVIKAL